MTKQLEHSEGGRAGDPAIFRSSGYTCGMWPLRWIGADGLSVVSAKSERVCPQRAMTEIGGVVSLTGTARVWVWLTVVVAGLVTVGLVLVAVLADLDTAGQTASVVGAVVALAALLVSLIALFTSGAGGTGARRGRRVRGGRHSVVALGNITGSALGKDSKVTGPHSTMVGGTPAPNDGDDVQTGQGGIVALGDITDSALGEGSER